MALSYEDIVLERSDGVAVLTLNRPRRLNALRRQTLSELAEALDAVDRDPAVRAVLLRGNGRGFCAGGDVEILDETMAGGAARALALMRESHRVVLALHRLSKPVVAAVHGVAAGSGFSLALAADIRVAAEGTRFLQAFVRIGFVPDCGSLYFLSRLVGTARAKELMFTGDPIDAGRALAWGLVNQVVPPEELDAVAREWTRRLAAGPAQTLSLIKRLVDRSAEVSLEQALELEAAAQATVMQTDDAREGVRAFLEKRSPTFRGS